MSERREVVEYAAGIGLVVGAGVGLLIGVFSWGTAAPAVGIAFGAALGLVAGAVARLLLRRDHEVGP
jgi:uncharacterized membrane protein